MSQDGARSRPRSVRTRARRTETSEVDSELIPHPTGLREFSEGHYRLSFARERVELERVQQLRFEVFNLELGEGLESSWTMELDQDPYDAWCHHMMLIDQRTDELVGTYRMQTAEMARASIGFYCDQEFDLAGIPADVLEHSIDLGTQFAVFEPNAPKLWDNIRRAIEDFLLVLWRDGALLGDKPEKAYFVRCDRTTMTQNDLDNGRLICLVGIAPVKPAEFVIFRIGQWTADAAV